MTLPEIEANEFSDGFIKLMRNRMVQSYFKYGPVRDAKSKIDCIASAKERMAKYAADGNPEWLVDAANFLMMEFMFSPGTFRATSSAESPGRCRLDDASKFADNAGNRPDAS